MTMSSSLDGMHADRYEATFSGKIEVDFKDARCMQWDREILLVAKVRVKPPRFRDYVNGDVVRINVLGVQELALVKSEPLRQKLCETLGIEQPATFTVPEAGDDVTHEFHIEPEIMQTLEWTDDRLTTDVNNIRIPIQVAEDSKAPYSEPETDEVQVVGYLNPTKNEALLAFLSE